MSNIVLAAGSDDGYQISRSVRLRSSASAYLSRAYGSSGNTTTFTYSAWLKLPMYGNNAGGTWYASLLCAGNGTQTNSTNDELGINSSGQITFLPRSGVGGYGRTWTPSYRDPSAWYHIVLVVDLGNATNDLKAILYVNGQKITAYSGTSFLGSLEYLNRGYTHYIGRTDWGSGPNYTDQYVAEVNFIDGQALTPSSFGETDAITGVWKPKKYAGTYGTNGFYLNFSDNSAATAAAIGKDSSGNGNNWTPNNISLTSGVTYDSMIDTPTPYADGGNGRGNYPVINPLNGKLGTSQSGATANISLSNGNLTTTAQGSEGVNNSTVLSTMTIPNSGKWYWEWTTVTVPTAAASRGGFGIMDTVAANGPSGGDAHYSTTGKVYGYLANGNKVLGGLGASAVFTAYGATYGNGVVIGIALDMDSGTLTFYKDNVSQGTAFTGIDTTLTFLAYAGYWMSAHVNFGQRPFTYTPPTGYKALNTQNLPDPTIKKGSSYMNVLTWSGTGGAAGATRSFTGLGFQPDFVWEKDRASGQSHHLFDSVRGAGLSKTLASDSTGAEGAFNDTLYGYLSSFDADGFTSTNGSSTWDNWNKSGDSYVGWAWKKGATQGFDIVTYTGTGVARTVNHSLGVAPSMIIVKRRDATGGGSTAWGVYHKSLGATKAIWLNETSAAGTNTAWNNTEPTSSVFSVGTTSEENGSGTNLVAYLFAEVAGFSKFGSYTGNGSTDGPFVYCGFRPRYVMIKSSGTIQPWAVFDTSRNTYNLADSGLEPNASNVEFTGGTLGSVDFLSNGFKLRSTDNASNASGVTFVYACYAENPLKYANAR